MSSLQEPTKEISVAFYFGDVVLKDMKETEGI